MCVDINTEETGKARPKPAGNLAGRQPQCLLNIGPSCLLLGGPHKGEGERSGRRQSGLLKLAGLRPLQAYSCPQVPPSGAALPMPLHDRTMLATLLAAIAVTRWKWVQLAVEVPPQHAGGSAVSGTLDISLDLFVPLVAVALVLSCFERLWQRCRMPAVVALRLMLFAPVDRPAAHRLFLPPPAAPLPDALRVLLGEWVGGEPFPVNCTTCSGCGCCASRRLHLLVTARSPAPAASLPAVYLQAAQPSACSSSASDCRLTSCHTCWCRRPALPLQWRPPSAGRPAPCW